MDETQGSQAASEGEGIASAVSRRTVELRLRYPEIHKVDEDLVFVAYLLEVARFGMVSYGPVSIDVGLVEDLFVRSLPPVPDGLQHRAEPSFHAFYERLGAETAKTKTRRPNELHYLLAFMRSSGGLAARVFGELGVRPEAVEAFAQRQRQPMPVGAPEVYLSPGEVAQRLGVNEQTVRVWIRSGKLPASRLAGRRVLRIRQSDIEAVLEPVDPHDFQ